MQRRHPIAAAILLAIILPACSHTSKTVDNGTGFAVGLAASAMSTPPSSDGNPRKVVLPNPELIRCSTSKCPSVLPDAKDPGVVYPWQVSLDFTNGSVIGLIALYDDPTSINDVRSVVNERYGKFAFDSNGKTPVDLWRVEPEKLVINLSTNKYGMVQLIYLTFDPKHPTSEKVLEKMLDRMAKDVN